MTAIVPLGLFAGVLYLLDKTGAVQGMAGVIGDIASAFSSIDAGMATKAAIGMAASALLVMGLMEMGGMFAGVGVVAAL